MARSVSACALATACFLEHFRPLSEFHPSVCWKTTGGYGSAAVSGSASGSGGGAGSNMSSIPIGRRILSRKTYKYGRTDIITHRIVHD